MIFDKKEAISEILEIFKLPENAKFSEQMIAIEKAQAYLQALYEQVYREGFEKGIEATNKVNKR